ncbi:MAG TPA: hypothetical protein VNF75_05515 [Candidatus Dormibacteraeota bacterium]|nr:hypothetical protein [Candidatus Dormibacteraeota bacterium]
MSDAMRPDSFDASASGRYPTDIELDEAARNWVRQHTATAAPRPMRQIAADAAITSAIGRAYGAD